MQESNLNKLYVLCRAPGVLCLCIKGKEMRQVPVFLVLVPMVGIVIRETTVKHCYILFVCLFVYGAKDLTQDLA